MQTKDFLYLGVFALLIYLIWKMQNQVSTLSTQVTTIGGKITTTPTGELVSTNSPTPYDYAQAYDDYNPA